MPDTPEQVTLERVKDAIPYGVWAKGEQVVGLQNESMVPGVEDVAGMGQTGWRYLTPEQVHARITDCEGCGGSGWKWADDYRGEFASAKRPCPTCAPYRRLVEK